MKIILDKYILYGISAYILYVIIFPLNCLLFVLYKTGEYAEKVALYISDNTYHRLFLKFEKRHYLRKLDKEK